MKKEIERIIKNEGGLVNHPSDPGKLTYKGISQRFWPSWAGWEIVEHVIRMKNGNIKEANAELYKDGYLHNLVVKFYQKNFWDAVRADELGDALGFQVTDCAVNCSVKRAKIMLQKTLGVAADGIIGPQTLNALDLVPDMLQFIYDFNDVRRDYYRGLEKFDVFGKGWLNRVDHNDEYAREDSKC